MAASQLDLEPVVVVALEVNLSVIVAASHLLPLSTSLSLGLHYKAIGIPISNPNTS